MQESWIRSLARAGERVTGWAAACALAVLAVFLLLAARRTHREAAELAFRHDAHVRETGRLKAENAALRAEIRALEEDPVYVESVLRGRKMAESGEKTVRK
ncbi:MAG: hypothetical protein HYY17_15890 [Planctomycetes bacterium]|nr:hypothetical protein [Planctomycetota bacterium]